MKFTTAVLQFAPWSFSKHGSLQSCPSQFYRNYVTKEQASGESSPARIGTVVHSALEQPADRPAAEQMEELASAAGLTSEELEVVRTYSDSVDRFRKFEARFCDQWGVSSRHAELAAAILPDDEFTVTAYDDPKAFMRGKMDRAFITKNNDLVIFDHKTGKKRKLDDHAVQLYCYQVFGVSLFPGIRSVQCAIHHVADGSIEWEPPRTAADVRSKLRPWLVSFLNKHDPVLKDIMQGKAQMKPSWQCGFCKFRGTCTAGITENTQREADRERKKLKVVDGT